LCDVGRENRIATPLTGIRSSVKKTNPPTFLIFLAHFPKLKLGLSNHQSVCLPPIISEPPGRFS
jgi:hypothetical protein